MATLGGKETHPSRYLKATDLNYGSMLVTVSGAEWETVGDDRKVVLQFEELNKGLVLNKVNSNSISTILNNHQIELWTGGVIELYVTEQLFQGRNYDVIRVRAIRSEPELVTEEVPI